jgi:hypothetical protein
MSEDRVKCRSGYRGWRWDTRAGTGKVGDPSAETDDLGWPDGPPDDGLKLAGPDGLQFLLEIRGAGAVDSKRHTVLRLPASHRPWVAAPRASIILAAAARLASSSCRPS